MSPACLMRALRHAIVEAAAVLAFAPHINFLGSICIVSSLYQMRTTCVFLSVTEDVARMQSSRARGHV